MEYLIIVAVAIFALHRSGVMASATSPGNVTSASSSAYERALEDVGLGFPVIGETSQAGAMAAANNASQQSGGFVLQNPAPTAAVGVIGTTGAGGTGAGGSGSGASGGGATGGGRVVPL